MFSSFGSNVSEKTLAILAYVVPSSVPLPTLTVNVNCSSAGAAKLAAIKEMIPPSPAPDAEQLKVGLEFCINETKVRLPGRMSISEAFVAELGNKVEITHVVILLLILFYI